MKSTLKFLAAAMLVSAIATGCNMNKKSTSSAVPAMNVAAIDVPAPTSPPAQFTPQQPVTYDAPQAAAAEEPSEDAFASTEEIAPPRAAAPAKSRSRASVSGTKYKVKKGESLWSIAQAKYGNGSKWKAIAAANPKMDPNKIQAGQTIVLP